MQVRSLMSVAFNKQDLWGNSTGRCGRNHHLCFGKQASTSWLQRKMKPLLWKLQILAVNYCRRLFARTFILVRYSWFFFTVKLYEGVGKKGNFIPFAGSKSILLVVVACLRSSWSKALHHRHNRWPEAAAKPEPTPRTGNTANTWQLNVKNVGSRTNHSVGT